MPAIRKLNWDRLGPMANDPEMAIYALWPSPVGHDFCFQAAGFDEFADSDDEWDVEWLDIVDRAAKYLTRYGEPVVRETVEAQKDEEQLSWWQRLRGQKSRVTLASSLPLAERIVLASEDDQFNRCVVAFGEGNRVMLRTDAGHAILWIACHRDTEFQPLEMAAACANGRAVSQRRLDWSHLYRH